MKITKIALIIPVITGIIFSLGSMERYVVKPAQTRVVRRMAKPQ